MWFFTTAHRKSNIFRVALQVNFSTRSAYEYRLVVYALIITSIKGERMMPADHERAESVVTAFKGLLATEVCETVGEEMFEQLSMMVQEALEQERAEVAARFEALAKAVRSTVERPDIAL
jgi:hypothetical protein